MNHYSERCLLLFIFCMLCCPFHSLIPSTILVSLFASDPSVQTLYKMEVLRDVDSRTRPLFRVTADNGEEVQIKLSCYTKKGISFSIQFSAVYNFFFLSSPVSDLFYFFVLLFSLVSLFCWLFSITFSGLQAIPSLAEVYLLNLGPMKN